MVDGLRANVGVSWVPSGSSANIRGQARLLAIVRQGVHASQTDVRSGRLAFTFTPFRARKKTGEARHRGEMCLNYAQHAGAE